MKIVETTFERLPRERLEIGFEGENLRATVRIDCASVFAEYPNATPALIVKPLFADAYPVVVERSGTCVDWLITSEILSFTGDGEIQLVFYKDQVICKSAVSKIRVSRSLTVTGEMPDPVVQWIENANRKLAEVDAQIVELEGMVDTATDAATRAEQSASTASTKAEQAAGSAATATAKATEATNAAGTATVKASEAEQSAQTATEKATAAAESERIATAKAEEITTAASTATAKAEQATEAAETATAKAADASASATAAQTAATNASQSAQAASASQTAAEAAKTAAEGSATQAATSAQNASTAAQTATQKAAEATQSATNAATFAGTATTKAGEAAASAQAASDAQTAAEETAEQLADSLEQIDQNTQDIAELDERKANIDGYYPDMTVGNAEQLNSSKFVENSEPYTLRTSGGSSDIGNREYVDAVVGGTLAWNQAVRDEASENSTDFADIVTVTDAVEDAAGVKVKIEPVQDLHGYDHPWPAGGGVNVADIHCESFVSAGVTISANNNIISISGTKNGGAYKTIPFDLNAGTYYVKAFILGGTVSTAGPDIYIFDGTNNLTGTLFGTERSFTIESDAQLYVRLALWNDNAIYTNYQIGVVVSKTANIPSFTPYSNICPITGWDGVKVTRTGKNLLDPTVAFGNRPSIYTVNNDGSVTVNGSDGNAWTAVPSFPLKKGTYTFSRSGGSGYADIRIGYENYASGHVIQADAKWQTFTLTEDTSIKIKVGYAAPNYPFTEFYQIELGSTATAYEPYVGNTYDITLPTEAGTVYGGTLDVSTGELVVDRAMLTKTWAQFTNKIQGDVYLEGRTELPLINSTRRTETICNRLKYSSSSADYGHCFYVPSGGNYARVLLFSAEDTDEFVFVYPISNPQTYTLTASEIRTLLGTNNIWSDAGQTALTYTGTDEHLTLESGKKYLARISGTDSMLLGSGQEITAAKGTDNVFDLTKMFGTAVADYVYGQGAAFFRKWFPNTRYPYNAGELRHVEGLQSHDMVGFNLWDEEWEVGDYSDADGQPRVQSTRIRSKNPIPCLPNTTYYFKAPERWQTFFYDAEDHFISTGTWKANTTFTTPANCRYVRFYIVGTTTYKNDICISLAHNGSRNGEYEPYEKHSYPLDSTVILRGIPKVGANGVYWDGDRYLPDGTVERRYGVIDMGTMNWSYNTTYHVMYSGGIGSSSKVDGAVICPAYTWRTTGDSNLDRSINIGKTGWFIQNVVVRDNRYTDAAAFKAAMHGVMLLYELATPTTETAQPYHSTQWVSDWGTEEFVSTGIVPVGHETRYPANLRDKLQHLPDAASGNGSYLITQTDGQMTLTPFPAPPSTAGNYVLKATVVNGVATYTWEVAT